MKFYRLKSSQEALFVEAFALYEQSFPQYERRFYDKQISLLSNPSYHFNVLAEEGALAGILLSWEGSGYVYIEHFAINPALRGKALGSEALKQFCGEHSGEYPEGNSRKYSEKPSGISSGIPSLVILEIDPPVTETALRREHFYQRLGFVTNSFTHHHPAYRKEFLPHELVVLSYPRHLTETEYRLFQQELSNMIMKDAMEQP